MSKKGISGLNIYFLATFAFILALLQQTQLCGLLIGFAVIVEKDNWLTKQTIQAFMLSPIIALVSRLFNIVNFVYHIPYLGRAISVLSDLVNFAVTVAIFAVCIISIFKVIKGNDANVPLVSKFANWATGVVENKTTDSITTQD